MDFEHLKSPRKSVLITRVTVLQWHTIKPTLFQNPKIQYMVAKQSIITGVSNPSSADFLCVDPCLDGCNGGHTTHDRRSGSPSELPFFYICETASCSTLITCGNGSTKTYLRCFLLSLKKRTFPSTKANKV